MSESPVLDRILELLNQHGVGFLRVDHEPTPTSELAAEVRGEPLKIGGKALLLKCDQEHRLFVLPADRKLNSRAIKKGLGVKKIRFATADELLALTGLIPGSVPPFGNPILPFDLYVDSGIKENERIAFNAGSLTTSLIMNVSDYLEIAGPGCFDFSERH